MSLRQHFGRAFAASTLFLAASLLAAETKPTPAPAKPRRSGARKPAASPTAAAAAGDVKAWDIQPQAPFRVGDLVTVIGSGLDQVNSVLLAGSFSADIVEKHPDRLVIRVPPNPHGTGGYHYDVSFVVPGRPIVTTLLPITVLGANDPGRPKEAPGVGIGGPAPGDEHAYLNKEFTLEAGKQLQFKSPTGDLAMVEVDVEVKGAEVEVRVEPWEAGVKPIIRATWEGKIHLPVRFTSSGANGSKASVPKEITISLQANAGDKATGRLVVRRPVMAGEIGVRTLPKTKAKAN